MSRAIKKFRHIETKKEFYGFVWNSPEFQNKSYIIEVVKNEDGYDIPVSPHHSDEDVTCIKDFDDRGRQDPKLSDLRMVELFYMSGSSEKEIVHVDDVETLIKAKLELHFSPGVNPATKEKTVELATIRVGEIKNQGTFWHTTPGLGDAKKERGAQLYDAWGTTLVWKNPKLPVLA